FATQLRYLLIFMDSPTSIQARQIAAATSARHLSDGEPPTGLESPGNSQECSPEHGQFLLRGPPGHHDGGDNPLGPAHVDRTHGWAWGNDLDRLLPIEPPTRSRKSSDHRPEVRQRT